MEAGNSDESTETAVYDHWGGSLLDPRHAQQPWQMLLSLVVSSLSRSSEDALM
jgi:hypothetical protein